MKSYCLPFTQVPGSSKLFNDFLSWSPAVHPFYSRSPHFSEWCQNETTNIRYEQGRREQVSAILERQNKNWEASPKTLENIRRFKAGAFAAVSGQQVGLFGGPLFTIFKALTAIKLADEATKKGVNTVPVFWLASQDHDLEEVNHTFLPGQDTGLQKLAVGSQGVSDAPVGTIKFGAEIEEVVAAAQESFGECEVVEWLRNSYRSGETYGSAFARLLARVFADWGVILMDASDPEFTAIAKPLFRAAIERSPEIEQALQARGKDLEAAGYHQQVKVVAGSTLMFATQNGSRTPVHRTKNDFVIGEEKLSQADLLERISTASQGFSANVLLRPVLQDYLLPTLAYTGGPAEIVYFAQAGVVYNALLGRVTPIIPRFSATLIEPRLRTLLEKYSLTVPQLFAGVEAVRQFLAARALPEGLNTAFTHAHESLKASLERVSNALERLDKTLVDSAKNAGEKMRYQLEQLQSRAARAELRQSEVLNRHAELLSNSLYPNKMLQEREIGGIYFLARHGTQLLNDIYDNMHLDCLDHQLIDL